MYFLDKLGGKVDIDNTSEISKNVVIYKKSRVIYHYEEKKGNDLTDFHGNFF